MRVASICQQDRPEIVHEKDGTTVRAVHGCHRFDDLCAALVRAPEMVELAVALLDGPVYVYQFKVNLKEAHEGAAWPWHQDFSFWHAEDGMPAPHAVTVAISLDDVHEANGPLVVVPGSHHAGLVEPPASSSGSGTDWRSHVSSDLAYTVDEQRVAPLVDDFGSHCFVGLAGSVHAFHPNLLHCSAANASDDRRAMLLITYNRVDNAPRNPTRPDFLVDRDTAPVTPQMDPRVVFVVAA